MHKECKQFDALIVGGGMVGLATAIGLAQQGAKVCILEASPVDASGTAYSPSFDERSTALSYGSSIILSELGVWSELAPMTTAIKRIHVSEKGRLGVTRLNADDYALDALGYVAPNQAIGQSLLSRVSELDIELRRSCLMQSAKPVNGGYRVTLSEDEHLDCRLLIIADGAQSSNAKRLGVEYQVQPYGQHALIANVSLHEAHEHCAYERFTSNGPLALLPLSDDRMALVWTLADDEVDRVRDLSDQSFLAELDAQFGGRFDGFKRLGERHVYPLNLSYAKECFRPNLMVLGNAAHSLHPVAGQGFNLALRGVAALLQETQKTGADNLGEVDVLSRAANAHAMDQVLTIQASDKLVKGFTGGDPMLSLSRELGLIGLNNMPVLKRLFAEQAMGLGGAQYKIV